MLKPDQVTIVLPLSAGEVDAIAGDILAVAEAAFGVGDYSEFIDWLRDNPHVLTMAYVDGTPAGWVRIDDHAVNPEEVGPKCLEFSGGVMPEYEGQGLTDLVAPIAIERAFALSGKRKMVATIDQANVKAAAGLTRLGFEYRATDTEGRRIYRLKR